MTDTVAKVKRSIAREKKMPVWIEVLSATAVTDKAWKLRWTMATSNTNSCHRCGLELTDPVSKLVMYGPDCCKVMGINRSAITTPEAARAALRGAKEVFGVHEGWFPKKAIAEGSEVIMALLSGDGPEEIPIVEPSRYERLQATREAVQEIPPIISVGIPGESTVIDGMRIKEWAKTQRKKGLSLSQVQHAAANAGGEVAAKAATRAYYSR